MALVSTHQQCVCCYALRRHLHSDRKLTTQMQSCSANLLGHKGFSVGGELSHISASAPNTEAMSRWDVGEEEYVRVVWTLWYKSVSLGGIKAPGHLAKHADTLYYKQSCRGETSNSTNNSTSQVSMLRKSTDGGGGAPAPWKVWAELGTVSGPVTGTSRTTSQS